MHWTGHHTICLQQTYDYSTVRILVGSTTRAMVIALTLINTGTEAKIVKKD